MMILIESLETRTLMAALTTAALVEGRAAIEPVAQRISGSLSAVAVSPIEIQLNYRGRLPQPTEQSRESAEPTSLVVERSVNGVAFSPLRTLPSGVTTFSDKGLISNTMYTYRIRESANGAALATGSARTLKYGAGLTGAFSLPSAVTGTTRSILNYGATPNNSGNDDATAIKNAIAASSAGDEVYIPDGIYHIKARDIKLKTGVSIRGQTMNGAILSAVFTDQGVDNPNSQIFRVEDGKSNITISNLRFEMSGGQAMQYGIALGSGSTGVSNARRIAIRNVNIEGFERFAIAIRNCDNILIENSLLRNATALGGGGQGYGVMIGYPQTFNVHVKNNTIGPVIRHAVIIQYEAHHNLVEGNTAIDNTEDAYDLHGEDEYSNELRYNIAHGGDGYGFGIGNTGSTHDDSGPNNWIHHNEVYNSKGGVNIILGSDLQFIEDNNFHDNFEAGVKVNNGGGSDLWFLRNTIRANPVGARFEDASNVLMYDNIITGNAGSPLIFAPTTSDYGVFRNDLRGNGSAVQNNGVNGILEDNLL
jgi:hypothetical protein